MYLLYADESGSLNDAKQQFFVLAGVSVFERQTYWLTQSLDGIVSKHYPSAPHELELHGSPMHNGRNRWRTIPDRKAAIIEALSIIKESDKTNRLFAVVVDKSVPSDRSLLEIAYEQLASRFDMFLGRLHRDGNTQRGVIIFDKSTYEETIQQLTNSYIRSGHTWGRLRNLSEVPLFIDSEKSRLIQLADLVAFAVFRKYNFNDNTYFDVIKDRFDKEGQVAHGLWQNW